jgi:DNA-binding transcriptional MerR regulator
MTDNTDSIHAALNADLEEEDLYPIREVSRLTGVNPITLRAWERRYGMLVPHRTPSGHRLYSMADIERVRQVTVWIERGVAVSKVASIIDREVAAREAPQVDRHTAGAEAASGLQDWQIKLVEAVNSIDLVKLEAVYGQAHAAFPVTTVLYDIALPVWKLFRDKSGSEVASGQWAFLDAFLRGRLFQRIGYLRADLPTVLLVVMPGSACEFEILSIAALIVEAEANVTYIPVMSSYAELTAIAERSSCDALVLYGDHALDGDALSKALPRMEQALGCPLAAVGPVCEVQPAELEAAGIQILGAHGHGLVSKIRGLLAGRLDSL